MEILGWLATLIFGMCYWPQLYRSYKIKSVGDVSIWMWILQALGYLVALFYGLWLKQGPLIVGYAHGLLCSVVFLIMYLKYSRGK